MGHGSRGNPHLLTSARIAGSNAFFRGKKDKKSGRTSFKQVNYNSSTTQQLLRLGVAHEHNSHRKGGRTRLSTTGRKTLCRSVPKWESEAANTTATTSGSLLDAVELKRMLAIAIQFFEERPLLACVPLKAICERLPVRRTFY